MSALQEAQNQRGIADRLMTYVGWSGLGTVAGAAGGALLTAYLGNNIATAGLQAGGNALSGGVGALLFKGLALIGLSQTQGGQDLLNVGVTAAGHMAKYGPMLTIGGGGALGFAGGMALGDWQNGVKDKRLAVEITQERKAKAHGQAMAPAAKRRLEKIRHDADMQAEQLGLLSPGSSPVAHGINGLPGHAEI